jgi:hypothetical protein
MAARSIARVRLLIVTRAIEMLIGGAGRVGLALVIVTAIVLACVGAGAGVARADAVDDESRELLAAPHYKRRLAAALTLSKVHDGRAVRALAVALEQDDDAKLRQVAALALAKAISEQTPGGDREIAFAALQRVTVADRDARVRELAARTLTKLSALRAPARPPAGRVATGSTGGAGVPASASAAGAGGGAAGRVAGGAAPNVFIYVAAATDASAKATTDSLDRLTVLVRGVVVRRAPELSTQWPGPLPTAKALGSSGTRAFSVMANIAAVDVVQRGGTLEITCKVQVRVQPWNGVDGAEKWIAHKAASASGEGRATTPATARAMAGGIRECVMAVAEEVTVKQVVPFLRKVVASS